MRPHRDVLLAALIMAAPVPAAAQVSVDLNALNRLNATSMPTPPPAAPGHAERYRHASHRIARAARDHHHRPEATVASAAGQPRPEADALQHPKNLGPSFASLPALPEAAPALPTTIPAVQAPPAVATATKPPRAATAAKPPRAATAAKPPAVATAAKPPRAATAKPAPAPPPPSPPPQLALPTAAPPPPPAAAAPPARLAEATPAPPAIATAGPALPQGADRLTLPFFAAQSDLPAAEGAMLRDFAQRHGPTAEYIIRAFAAAPPGDADPSSPRRISLGRAQSIAAALAASGVQADHVRMLALGDTGGAADDRVDVITMPPASRHTPSSPSP